MLKLDGIVFYIVTMEGKEPETSPSKVTAVEKACQMANYATVNDVHPTVTVSEIQVAELPEGERKEASQYKFQTQARTVLVL